MLLGVMSKYQIKETELTLSSTTDGVDLYSEFVNQVGRAPLKPK